jgi:flagellar biosynthesis protein FliP
LSGHLLAAMTIAALALPQASDGYAQTTAPNSAQSSSRSATAPTNAGKASAVTLPANANNGTLSINSAPLAGGGTSYSVPIQTLLVFTALSFLPAILLLMTSFTRIIIVLSLLRQALGLQTTPPNQVLVGMALFLTLFVMGPTLDRVHALAYKPYAEQKISLDQALESGAEPLRAFMLKQTRAADLTLFANIAKLDGDLSPATIPMRILIPAFVTSELKTAFQIGFLVFVPFLIIDLIVASVLMSMGMMMLSPVLVALPFKLMLFVLADGWSLLMSSLVASFGGA